MSDLIPSPLLGGVPKHLPDVAKEYCEKIAKDLEADAVMLIVFRKHDFTCEKKVCDGYHILGQDFNVNHEDAHRAVETIVSVYHLDEYE